MQALNLKRTAKNLTLIAVGAIMATMIAVPLTGNASADDEKPYLAPAEAVTYTITGSDGQSASFALLEIEGEMALVLQPEQKYFPGRIDDGEDDDD